jgi:hypothetical protein
MVQLVSKTLTIKTTRRTLAKTPSEKPSNDPSIERGGKDMR